MALRAIQLFLLINFVAYVTEEISAVIIAICLFIDFRGILSDSHILNAS